MQQKLRVPFESLDLFLPQSFLIRDILLTLKLPMLSTIQRLLGAIHRRLLPRRRISLFDHFLLLLFGLFLLVDMLIGIIIDLFLLLDLVRMVYYLIGLQVKL